MTDAIVGFSIIWVVGMIPAWVYCCCKTQSQITRTEVASCIFWPILLILYAIKWAIILIQELLHISVDILTTKWW